MADILDIETALATLCGSVIYPNGTSQPSAAGIDCKIFAGWPNSAELATSLAAGVAEVSIYSGQNLERDTTRYAREWYDVTLGTPTLSAGVSNNIVTIGGAVTAGNYVTLVIDGASYSYAALVTDTLASIASALAALVPVALVTSVVGAVITFNAKTSGRITSNVAAPGVSGREIGRTQRGMMISIWAPSPQARSAIASLLMVMVMKNTFTAMPDGSQMWLTYRQSNESDGTENAMAYRRDIQVWAEYATIETVAGYPITSTVLTQTVVPFVPAGAPALPTGAVVESLSPSIVGNATTNDDAVDLTLQSHVNISAGMAAHVDLVTRQLVLADKSAYATASVAGLMAADVVAGFAGVMTREQLTLPDWTLATGASTLVPGATYFLGTAGQITTTVPSSGYLVNLGVAKNTNTLMLNIQPIIKL
jgi:hypothetical protein